jgi:hypothetical protein
VMGWEALSSTTLLTRKRWPAAATTWLLRAPVEFDGMTRV